MWKETKKGRRLWGGICIKGRGSTHAERKKGPETRKRRVGKGKAETRKEPKGIGGLSVNGSPSIRRNAKRTTKKRRGKGKSCTKKGCNERGMEGYRRKRGLLPEKLEVKEGAERRGPGKRGKCERDGGGGSGQSVRSDNLVRGGEHWEKRGGKESPSRS